MQRAYIAMTILFVCLSVTWSCRRRGLLHETVSVSLSSCLTVTSQLIIVHVRWDEPALLHSHLHTIKTTTTITTSCNYKHSNNYYTQIAAQFCAKWRHGRHLEIMMTNLSIDVYLKDIAAKFHPDLIWNDWAFGFFMHNHHHYYVQLLQLLRAVNRSETTNL